MIANIALNILGVNKEHIDKAIIKGGIAIITSVNRIIKESNQVPQKYPAIIPNITPIKGAIDKTITLINKEALKPKNIRVNT
ncbi:unnamed protein product, partial [marine sediment metagenome]